MIREEYIRNKRLAGIPINESYEQEWEYQIRDVDGAVFYKRRKGDKLWIFISVSDFIDNFNASNLVK